MVGLLALALIRKPKATAVAAAGAVVAATIAIRVPQRRSPQLAPLLPKPPAPPAAPRPAQKIVAPLPESLRLPLQRMQGGAAALGLLDEMLARVDEAWVEAARRQCAEGECITTSYREKIPREPGLMPKKTN